MEPSRATDAPVGLGFAVWKGDVARVRQLLQEGAAADDYGDGVYDVTPVMVSVDEPQPFYDSDNEEITRLLLDNGADVDRRDGEGRTALHYATRAGGAAVVLLLNAGADPNAQSTDGSTPLHDAVRYMNTSAVEALRQHGADPRIHDRQGATASDLLKLEQATEEERTLILNAMS
ncbi:hypothetical protein GCM10028820_33710 [Tessaracoccus terricola]